MGSGIGGGGGGGVVVAKKAGRVTMARMVGGCKYGDSQIADEVEDEAENVASDSACLAAATHPGTAFSTLVCTSSALTSRVRAPQHFQLHISCSSRRQRPHLHSLP